MPCHTCAIPLAQLCHAYVTVVTARWHCCDNGLAQAWRLAVSGQHYINLSLYHYEKVYIHLYPIILWAKHPAPYPPCGGRFPSTRPQTVLTCLHVYGFPLVTLLFTIVLNHRVAVLTDNQCLAMSFEHQFLPLIIAFQLGESPHMMHDYFSFLTT